MNKFIVICFFLFTAQAMGSTKAGTQEITNQGDKENIISALVDILKPAPAVFSSCHDLTTGKEKRVWFTGTFHYMRKGQLYRSMTGAPELYASHIITEENDLWPLGTHVEVNVRLRPDQQSIAIYDFKIWIKKTIRKNDGTVTNPKWQDFVSYNLDEHSFSCIDQKR